MCIIVVDINMPRLATLQTFGHFLAAVVDWPPEEAEGLESYILLDDVMQPIIYKHVSVVLSAKAKVGQLYIEMNDVEGVKSLQTICQVQGGFFNWLALNLLTVFHAKLYAVLVDHKVKA